MLVAKQSGPPFRYQVVDALNPGKPVAITLTRWSAQILADELVKSLGGSFMVFDMDGNYQAPKLEHDEGTE